jgi:hypothetical protein
MKSHCHSGRSCEIAVVAAFALLMTTTSTSAFAWTSRVGVGVVPPMLVQRQQYHHVQQQKQFFHVSSSSSSSSRKPSFTALATVMLPVDEEEDGTNKNPKNRCSALTPTGKPLAEGSVVATFPGGMVAFRIDDDDNDNDNDEDDDNQSGMLGSSQFPLSSSSSSLPQKGGDKSSIGTNIICIWNTEKSVFLRLVYSAQCCGSHKTK